MIPRIYPRRIIRLSKPNGSNQYFLTVPKEYAQALGAQGIDRLLVVFNYGLAAFPITGDRTEEALLAFFSKHADLARFFTSEVKA